MSKFKLGRLPATRPAALKDLAVYSTGPLPTPPAAVTAPKVQFPIDGNDQYGDCTIAGADHLVRAWNADTGQHDHLPTEQQIIAKYLELSPGDEGCNEADVLKTWRGPGLGLFGGQIRAYAPVNPQSVLQLHQAIAFYGGAYLGIECPQSAQEQFQAGHQWTYVPGSPVEGGHCIVAVGYTQTALICATWGGLALVTYGFLAHYLDEAWVILSHELVEAKGDQLGLDLTTLEADLSRV